LNEIGKMTWMELAIFWLKLLIISKKYGLVLHHKFWKVYYQYERETCVMTMESDIFLLLAIWLSKIDVNLVLFQRGTCYRCPTLVLRGLGTTFCKNKITMLTLLVVLMQSRKEKLYNVFMYEFMIDMASKLAYKDN